MNKIVIQVGKKIFSKKAVKELENAGYEPVFVNEHNPIPEALCDSVVGIILPDNTLDDTTLANLPVLRVVSRWGVGYDSVDVAACTRKGIIVTNTPGCLEIDVAEFTIGLMYSLTRQIPQAHHYVKSGLWNRTKKPFHLTRRMSKHKLGIVGMGRIGREVYNHASTLFDDIVFYDPFVKEREIEPYTSGIIAYKVDTLKEIFETCNMVSLHCPLTEDTKELVGIDLLHNVPRPFYLINMARGPVVKLWEITYALEKNIIDGAALDVFLEEPLDNNKRITSLPNVILTPHIGSATVDARHLMSMAAVKNTIGVLTNKMDKVNTVN